MDKSILVIAGASGVGKTTVATHLIENSPDFELVRSVTTRAPRGDTHDAEYIYTDREGFLKKAEAGELIEYMEYSGNMYGTPLSELERIFGEGKTPLLILDIEGVKSLRSKSFDFTSVIAYIWDDLNTIERRLYERDLSNNPTAEKLISFVKRKEMNVRDYLAMPQISHLFDYFVRNEGIEDCSGKIKSFFDGISSGKRRLAEDNSAAAALLYEMAKNK